MDKQLHKKIRTYLEGQISNGGSTLSTYLVDMSKKVLSKRDLADDIQKIIKGYQKGSVDPRWIIIPGLRGVGKTTLLAQIYSQLNVDPRRKLYISLDVVVSVIGVGSSLYDILAVYEEIINSRFEELQKPVYLFIDEVHYQENWGLILKNVYDRSKNVFIFCTGSSALELQTNADISRRSFIRKLYPLSFSEYLLIKNGVKEDKKLGIKIKEAIFNSVSAEESYNKLKQLEQKVKSYWLTIDKIEIDRYIKYGTLPFTLSISNIDEAYVYIQIERTYNDIRIKDIPKLGKFDLKTIDKIGPLLYAISGADIVSVNTLVNTIDLSDKTLKDLFDVLSLSELLLRIYPYGSTHFKQVRKASKYLFLSSAYRSMFFNIMGSNASYDQYKGKLLEDIIALYIHKIIALRTETALNYDPSDGGADFIVKFINKNIVIEVGYGEKGFRQIESTLKKVNNAFGISISQSELTLSYKKNSLLIPLEFFLLI